MSVDTYLPGVIFIPSSLDITAITNSYPMVITVSVNPVTESNTYRQGQLVKLNVPYSYGMFQADGLTGQIIAVVGNNITVDIDSTLFDTFIVPLNSAIQPASIAPAGSRNLAYSNDTTQVAFQPLNNTGN